MRASNPQPARSLRSRAGLSRFPHVGTGGPPRPLRTAEAGDSDSRILRVTRRAQSAYLRPSDLSCCLPPAVGPGGVLASRSPGLPGGGAWAALGGARVGGGAGGHDSVESAAAQGPAAR